MSRADALRPGARVGRYRLLERVGAGGMAEVFAARTDGAEGFSRVVAIKVVHADAEDEEHLLALIDEARVASSLHHPNIVQVHELDRHGDGLYMVMEFLDGWALDRLLKLARQKGIAAPPDVVIDLGSQVLDALAYAHHARVDGAALDLVHRDIKPSNLMLDGLGLVKVVDFGIARASNVERRTATGVGKGTPSYMSPEQLYGRPVDARSDVFATGCVLFELATGERLFDADAFGPLILRRTEGFTDADMARLQAAQPATAEVIAKACAQDPDARWGSAQEMAAALRACGPTITQRASVLRWLGDVLGGDPAALVRTVSDPGQGPGVATADGGLVATAAMADGVEPTAAMPAMESSSPGVGPHDVTRVAPNTVEATRLVPSRRSSRAPWVLGLAALVLAGVGILGLATRETAMEEPEAAPGATAEEPEATAEELPVATSGEPNDATAEELPEATTALAREATPEPTPESAPGRAASEPPPEPTTPTPVAVATPTPAPPEPTPAPPLAHAAKGTLFVSLTPDTGIVRVPGFGQWSTPGRKKLPPGEHPVQLLDKSEGLLGTAVVRVKSGVTSACSWDLRPNGDFVFVPPDPEYGACELVR